MGLPKPSGPFLVGCFDLMTKAINLPTKLTCPFSLLEEESVDLGIFARIYYPSEPDLPTKDYIETTILPVEQTNLYAKGLLASVKLSWISGLAKYSLRKAVQHAYIDTPLVSQPIYDKIQSNTDGKTTLPLVVFSHGIYGYRNMYSTLCSDLASHGYIVAAIEHRDGSASPTYFKDPASGVDVNLPFVNCMTNETADEKSLKIRHLQVEKRAQEVSKLLDVLETLNENPENVENCYPSKFDLSQLKGRIDISEPLMFGHSFGGATTLNVIKKDDRFKCAIVLDPWMLPLVEERYESNVGYKKPTFIVFTELFNWGINVKKCKLYLSTFPEDYGEVVTLKDAVHVDQSDAPGFTPWMLSKLFKTPPGRDFENGIVLQRKLFLDFFGKYLEHKTYPVKLLTDDYELPDKFFLGMCVHGHGKDGDEEDELTS